MSYTFNIKELRNVFKEAQATGASIYEGNALESPELYGYILLILKDENLHSKYPELVTYCLHTLNNIEVDENQNDDFEEDDDDF